MRLASGKMTRLNASTNEATVAAIVERFGGNKRIVASIVHLIDHGCQFYKVCTLTAVGVIYCNM